MKRALVIIPTYNERENVEAISKAVLRASGEVDILFVDDHSPDGTGDLLDRLSASEQIGRASCRERV